MGEEHLPEPPAPRSFVGRFLRRMSWNRKVGPLSAGAAVEVRQLDPEPKPSPGSSGGEQA